MNTTVQILGAILVIVTVIGTTQAWRDGRKWRQRRIAHVFGKRDGPDSNLQMPALDGEESDMRAGMSDIGLSPLSNDNSDILRNYLLSRNDQFSPLDEGEKSQDDYDKYPTDADHIPQRVIDRLSYLDLLRLRLLRTSDAALMKHWGDLKSYLDYPQEQ